MINVLITGANGQLGKTLNELLALNNFGIKWEFQTKDDLDITNKKRLELFFKTKKVDVCVNCAAYTNVEQAEKTPEIAYKVNSESVKNLAEICKINQTTLIHISTDYVFDGEKSNPYTINDIPNPINEYGKSKLLGEQHIENTLSKYFIIRTSWLYSKQYGKNFYRTIIEKSKLEHTLSITTEQTGCPTDAKNLAKFIIQIVLKNQIKFGIYHFTDGKEMTWYEFARQILKENNLLTTINLVKSDKYHTFAKRPKYSVLQNNYIPHTQI